MLKIVTPKEGMRLSKLLSNTTELKECADTVYKLIADDILHVDLSAAALVERDQVYVYSTRVAVSSPGMARSPKPKFIDFSIGERIHWGNRVFEIDRKSTRLNSSH